MIFKFTSQNIPKPLCVQWTQFFSTGDDFILSQWSVYDTFIYFIQQKNLEDPDHTLRFRLISVLDVCQGTVMWQLVCLFRVFTCISTSVCTVSLHTGVFGYLIVSHINRYVKICTQPGDRTNDHWTTNLMTAQQSELQNNSPGYVFLFLFSELHMHTFVGFFKENSCVRT